MKKKLIALLLVVAPLLCTAQMNNNQTQFPEVTFRSVNTYTVGTTYQSQITPVGSTTVYGTNNTTGVPYRTGPRKIGYPEDPMASPIGDAPIALMLGLGVLYVLIMRKKERVED